MGGQARPGIIPAYAGSTSSNAHRTAKGRDHPRIRGEHQRRVPLPRSLRGSSPHTRGARGLRDPVLEHAPDHPRIRGEHCQAILPVSSLAGSSPHTRGARAAQNARHGWKRIIPAYAGSTRHCFALPSGNPDHPRIRGEHSSSSPTPSWKTGSSPHTRGARAALRIQPAFLGIIPAYAGSTRRILSRAHPGQDHPRIRGEHAPDLVCYPEGARIIPAYAGSTRNEAMARTGMKDHPRIRGEHHIKGDV